MARPDWQRAIKTPLGILPGGSGNGLAASLLHSAGERFAAAHAAFLIAKGEDFHSLAHALWLALTYFAASMEFVCLFHCFTASRYSSNKVHTHTHITFVLLLHSFTLQQ